MTEPFNNDPAWVKFKCLEIAAYCRKGKAAESIVKDAEKMFNYIMPKAKELQIKGGKDASQKR